MLKEVSNINEIEFILSHLRKEDEEELKHLYGKNWYKNTLESLKDEKFLILYGYSDNKKTQIPIAMGGFFEITDNIACVWLLSSYFIKINKRKLMKALREQVLINSSKYEIMYNFIYKSNTKAKLWLKKLGFCFDNPKPEGMDIKKDFEFFYKKQERRK